MKNILSSTILSVFLLTCFVIIAGCSQKSTVSEETISVSTITETTTVTGTNTTLLSTTVTTSAVTTTAEQVTTTTETTYAHHFEISNTKLGSRPVPENLYHNEYTGEIKYRAQKAIDEGRDMLGDCIAHCIDYDNNIIYLCMYYGGRVNGSAFMKSNTFYRINADTGEVTELCNDENSDLKTVDSMFLINGKLFVVTYFGFYTIDTESGEITVIDPHNEPCGGGGYINDGKIYLLSHEADDSRKITYLEYDTETDTLTKLNEWPDTSNMEYYTKYIENEMITEGDHEGVQKFIFQWN
ncbi:MAG: hypothetical protein J6Y71_09400 [Ruminococcus sp.]|nr:hypothetical protein [Ruminococcus sp.]